MYNVTNKFSERKAMLQYDHLQSPTSKLLSVEFQLPSHDNKDSVCNTCATDKVSFVQVTVEAVSIQFFT